MKDWLFRDYDRQLKLNTNKITKQYSLTSPKTGLCRKCEYETLPDIHILEILCKTSANATDS